MKKCEGERWRLHGERIRAIVALFPVLLLGLSVGGCNKSEVQNEQTTVRTVWSNEKPREPGEEGSRRKGGGSIVGLFKKGGEGLWKEACDHAIDVMMRGFMKDVDDKIASASPDDRHIWEDSKREMEKAMKDLPGECLEEFKEADADAADEAASCMMEAKHQNGVEACARLLKGRGGREMKKEEKKEERK